MSFGTAYKPPEATNTILSEFVVERSRLNPDAGIIYVNKDFVRSMMTPQQKEFSKRYPNIFLSNNLPLIKLLANNKTIALVSHGGQNQFIEAMEAQVPILIVPGVVFDHHMYCKYVHHRQYGFCMDDITTYKITRAIA